MTNSVRRKRCRSNITVLGSVSQLSGAFFVLRKDVPREADAKTVVVNLGVLFLGDP